MIEIKDVSYSYEGVVALQNVSLVIEQGESVVLIGANGSGKSTLLKLLNGIIFPSHGSYRYDGEEITETTMKNASFSKRFHQRIGFVFQNSDTQLFTTSVFDEIAFGPRQMGYVESIVESRVRDCLELLDIQKLKDRSPCHLSGGEKRKVAIACVLSLNPEVLVLDEPMNGLDPKTQRWLADFALQLNRAGKTVISSTHNLELTQEIAKRVILFDEAHCIAADLPTEELLSDVELLKRCNLVDDTYHRHMGTGHHHFHMHRV